MPETYSISDLAAEFGVTSRTLRFYEDKGLIQPLREGTSRIYRQRDRARLRLILRGKRLGFSLAEIKEVLDLYNVGDGQVTQMRTLLARSRERIEALKSQRQDIDDAIAELAEGCAAIERFLKEKSMSDKAKGPASEQADNTDSKARAVG
ncbi:MAG: MerR family DNA-binding transcriptional regulator [Minwuiales bacterium]|nr:MerR family DNA-binding transcriptional regulator [Minwuiales bacterium]